jgi:hypothetical protein
VKRHRCANGIESEKTEKEESMENPTTIALIADRLRVRAARRALSVTHGGWKRVLGLTRVAGEPDVLKRVHELNLFRAVCLCWFRRSLVDAGQCRSVVAFGDKPKRSLHLFAIQFDADLVIRFAVGLVPQSAFKDFSIQLQSPLCLVDFPGGAARDGDEFPFLAGLR